MHCKVLNDISKIHSMFDRNLIRKIFHQRSYKTSAVKSLSALPATEVQPATNVDSNSERKFVNPLRFPDYFEVQNLFTVKDLFDARVHLGHKVGSLNEKMSPYIFGSRFDHIIFDLEQTAIHLRNALNVTAHIAYRGGIVLFAGHYPQHCQLIEQTAIECKEYAMTRHWRRGLFTNSTQMFKGTIRLPDLVIMLNTLDNVLNQHELVREAAKSNIPSIAVVDSNCDPTIVTYPVPGNDDTPSAIQLYLSLFKQAILKGKEIRQKEFEN